MTSHRTPPDSKRIQRAAALAGSRVGHLLGQGGQVVSPAAGAGLAGDAEGDAEEPVAELLGPADVAGPTGEDEEGGLEGVLDVLGPEQPAATDVQPPTAAR